MKQFCVLLSTYNGEKYIVEQLNSIFSQEIDDCHIKVVIRDDKSTDGTVQLCKDYAQIHGYDIDVIEGNNIRPARSFLKLINESPKADFYAFCDQDDVWLPGKVRAATACINNDEPILWISNYSVVDVNLNVVIPNALEHPETDPLKILFYNNVPGCVMVFNHSLIEEIKALRIDDFRMHDILVLDVARLLGRVIFDKKSYILYRQHGDNVLGFGNKKINPKTWLRDKMKYIASKEDCHYSEYASKMLSINSTRLSGEQIVELRVLANYKKGIVSVFKLLSRKYTHNGLNRTAASIRMKILLRRM